MASHQCSIFSAYLILLICPVKNGGITEAQVAELRGQITAERETRLEIAKADAGRAGVVVNAGKN